MLVGVALVLTKGYDNVVTTARGERPWRRADRKQIDQILELNRKSREWDQDFFDITCGRGAAALVAVAIVVGAAALYAAQTSETLAAIVVADSATLLVPFWITGVRFVLTNDTLVVKASLLGEIARYHQGVARAGEEFQFQVQYAPAKSAQGSGEIPEDVKAIVQMPDAPEGFYGLQMQISINMVQGARYPYYYCVLVGKAGFGRLGESSFAPPPGGITLECDAKADAEVAVIRQTTTRNSGYHTRPRDAVRIFEYALGEARRVAAGPGN